MSMFVQVDEVAAFVANNARRVLGVDAAQVLPVSARAALDAKLASTTDKRGFFGEQPHDLLDSMDDCMLLFCMSMAMLSFKTLLTQAPSTRMHQAS